MRQHLGARVGLLLVLVTGLAEAQTPRAVRLDYSAGAGAGCLGGEGVRTLVRARLGYDPFDDRAPQRLLARIARDGSALTARIELLDASGRAIASRTIRSASADCAELTSAMTLAISIAIDPFAVLAPPQREKPPSPPPREDAPVLVPPPPPASRPLVARFALGPTISFGTAPSAAWGVRLAAGLQRGGASLSLEGRVDLDASTSLGAGSVSASLLTGSLVPCAHLAIAALCGIVSAGALRATGHDLADVQHPSGPFVALGARGAVEVELFHAFTLFAHVDVLVPLTQLTVQVGGRDVWTTSPVALSAGLSLGARF